MLGLVSNSEGRVDAVSAAIEIFRASGATYIVYCGDVGGRHVLDAVARIGGVFVWGDRDRDRMGLLRYAQSVGVDCFGTLGEFDYGEKKVVVTHGDDKKVLRKLIDEQQYDYVLAGHSLAVEDETVGRTRVISPGALYGGTARSAVLLEPISGKLNVVAL